MLLVSPQNRPFSEISIEADQTSFRLCVANIGWRTFIIFAVLNAAFIPMVYCFYPETRRLELEDIPLLFARGGFTGGVFSTRGKTVTPGQHAQEADVVEKTGSDSVEHYENVA